MSVKKIQIRNLSLSYAGFQDFTDYMYKELQTSDGQLIIVHINIRNYYFLNKDKILYNDIKNNSTAVFEGIGLKTCMAVKGYGFLNDLNGTDLFPLFMKKLEGTAYRIFFLGASEKALEGTLAAVKSNFPGVNITGYHNGYFEPTEEPNIVDIINSSKSDILLVSMGFPFQEKFVFKYKDKLDVKLIWNLGGLFDIVSGLKKRAPQIIRSYRLEWLYRFCKEPVRMFHRNTVAAVWSFCNIILSKK